VTKENVESVSLLAKEFCFEELQSECLKVLPDPISSLSERVSKFEEQIESHERRLENLCHEIEK
jgi:gas vesicle protein